MTSLKDINDPTEAMNAALILFSKAFKLTAPTNNQRTSSNPRNRQIAQPGLRVLEMRIKSGATIAEDWVTLLEIAQPDQREGMLLIFRLSCSLLKRKKHGFNFKQKNLTSWLLQHDKALVYDTDGSAEVQLNDKCYNNEIFNMFTQEEQYTYLLDPILEPQLVPQNDNHVTSVTPSMVQSGSTVETSFAPNEETHQKIALGYPNLSYLKKAQLKQQSLYNGNLLLEEHDPPVVYDSEETLELALKSHEKMRFLKKEIKPANYAKINHLSGVFVPQTTKSKESLVLSNVSNMVTVSKMISIPNEDLSDDTTPSVARKFLNEVKNSLMTLQRVVKQKMTLEVHNWSSFAHKEVHKIISHEIAPIFNQVDARVQNFEIQFLQEAAKFVRDFKSFAKEADESLDKKKSLELKIKRLLKLDRTKEKLELCIIKKEKEYDVLWNNCHLKTTYKNLFDSITSNRAHAKLHNLIYENAKLRAWLFENTSESMNNTSRTSVTPQVDKPKLIDVTPCSKKLHASTPSHSVPQPREFNVVKHSNVIAPGMFKIDPSQTSRVDLVPNNQSSASIRTNPITNVQRHVTSKENVSSDMVNASSIGLVHTARTRRPQHKGDTRNARVSFASKSSEVKKNVTVEDHRRILLLSKNQKTMSSECNNIKLAIRNDKSKIVCGTYKQCLVIANHDACLLSFVNALNSRANNMCANAP
nr:hypothetical protein [Tanacetum cinerariifolium]